MFQDKVAVITGGAHGIGACIAASFRAEGAETVIIDKEPGDWYTGDIADMVLHLCSDKAGFINGENICIDGGMTHLMIYHGDHGWALE